MRVIQWVTFGIDSVSDYASDGCETWNSHRALSTRIMQEMKSSPVVTPVKRRPVASAPTSVNRIWRHDGKSVSTPCKNRPRGHRGRSLNLMDYSDVCGVEDVDYLDRTALSTRSTRSNRSNRRRRRGKSDALHGNGIYNFPLPFPPPPQNKCANISTILSSANRFPLGN